jgi:predicted ATP-dependent endonuclease of OLD family
VGGSGVGWGERKETGMKIRTLKIKNFRGYKDEVIIDFSDLTAFVGKNDVGKSSVLEALDIFFYDGKGSIKLVKEEDTNNRALAEGNKEISLSVCFDDIPNEIVIDDTNVTTLRSEYLLNTKGQLEIIKKFETSASPKVFVKAFHPTNLACNDLLSKKQSELKEIIKNEGIECADKTKNAAMRTAIWGHYRTDLQLAEVDLDITKGETKSIYEKIMSFLPLYTLFQSDRKNSDADGEVQDPLKRAVEQILKDARLQEKLSEVATEVVTKLKEVSARTLDKLREMNPDVANSLNPVIPAFDTLKWEDVFKKVSIVSDDDIPINKRGSGIKRLVLLNFFRAEAERRREERNSSSIIYAIEEPETSQHTEHQKMMIEAFKALAEVPNTQIFITTHSAAVVKKLEFENLRMVSQKGFLKTVEPVEMNLLPRPSLNEANYVAFDEITEEYHNELYGHIEEKGHLGLFKNEKKQIDYIKLGNNGPMKPQKMTMTEYIRHQIHHPENTHNYRFTDEQLRESICLMRDFISSTATTPSDE